VDSAPVTTTFTAVAATSQPNAASPTPPIISSAEPLADVLSDQVC
jgi:hypothetical protein